MNDALANGCGPLDGVRVLEAGRFASAPSCATLLADWGADVIKIEPLSGDPARGPGSASASGESYDGRVNPRFELHNRGRRSLAIDLKLLRGREIVALLLDRMDVFVTNMRERALYGLELDWPRLHTRHPRLVYGQITGYGKSPIAVDRASYDHGAFWSYSGAAMSFAQSDGSLPQPAGGLGDRATGTALAAGIAAALFDRERTSTGRLVNASLLGAGMWLLGSDASDALAFGHVARPLSRVATKYPTMNCYRSSDGRWFWLQVMIPEEDWQLLLDAIDAKWIDDDPRFRGGAPAKLAVAGPALVNILDRIFASRPLEEWNERFNRYGICFAPVLSICEAVQDPVVQESGALVDVQTRRGGTTRAVNSPSAFDDITEISQPAPHVGEHTAEILCELGFDDAMVWQLAESGVVRLGES